MSVSFRSFTLLHFASAAVALWLCGAGAAWATGGGGEDAPSAQQALNVICGEVGMPANSCPQLPTVAQIAAEISALVNSQIDDVRNALLFGLSATPCGNLVFVTGIPCPEVAINAANGPVKSPPEGPLAISELSPLAFAPGATVKQYGDPTAKRFLYAAVIAGSDGQPQTLDLILDDTLDTNKQFSNGQVVAFSLPVVILKQNNSETAVTATLKLTATCNGAANCLTGTVTGIPGTSPLSAAQLGIQFDSSFGTSPNSSTSHKQYELQLPIVAIPENDGAYFATALKCPNGNGANALSGYCNAFFKPARGFPANVLGFGASIGIAPYAAPLCTSATCPTQGTAQTLYFGFCASFPGELGPAVATFIDIGTDGTTVVTTPVSTQKLQCPPLS